MTLFDFPTYPPASRHSDPATSRAAEQLMNLSGRASHCRIVLAAVQKYPHMTAVELLPFCGLERHEISRRLADLCSRGAVRVSGQRRCRVRNTLMQTWEATTCP